MKIMEINPVGDIIGELDAGYIFPNRGERPSRYVFEFDDGEHIILSGRELKEIEKVIREVYRD